MMMNIIKKLMKIYTVQNVPMLYQIAFHAKINISVMIV